jgi:16S rRNA (cytosine1402-N4)-methyltransferase
MAEPRHIPVMRDEVVQWLALQEGQVVVDGTLGGGGHTRALVQVVGTSGLVLGMDRDPAAVAGAERNLAGMPVKVVQASYSELRDILTESGIGQVGGVVLDLGISSDQLADERRGFSFDSEGPLDLRFDPDSGRPAWQLLDNLPEKDLADLIYRYGEERYSRRIARRVVERRGRQSLRSAREVAHLVRGCVPRAKRGGIDSATRTFQALRIAVNEELQHLQLALEVFPDCLRPGGRVVVISFHSLEDRIVKRAFRGDPRYEVLTKKPVCPTAAEVDSNPRARSAKLRAAARTSRPFSPRELHLTPET